MRAPTQALLLRKTRLKLGLTLDAVAKAAHLNSSNYYVHFEKGTNFIPPHRVEALAYVLGLKTNKLVSAVLKDKNEAYLSKI